MTSSAVFSLANLNGRNGFRLEGIDADDDSGGRSVASAGDVNGDGFDDVIIGRVFEDPDGKRFAGESYVVFGSDAEFPATLTLTDLNGQNGFRLTGIYDGDHSGASVASAGDVNGDGFDDVIIGARFADANGISGAGESYVVFGSDAGFPAVLSLADLNGQNGFRLDGVARGDRSGWPVASAGDVNGDGFDDVIIGAIFADPDRIRNGLDRAGESYVVFGSDTGFPAALSLADLNGQNGFRLTGVDDEDYSGRSVASAGDVNGDGFDDVIIGARSADPNGALQAGESYVVYGSDAGFPATVPLADLNGQNGFVIAGTYPGGGSGVSVASAGDVNGDGFDDVIIGAVHGERNGRDSAGESYVVFGSNSGFPAMFSLADLNGQNGFVIAGVDVDDYSGWSVASAGDVNGDGFDDVIIGAHGGDPNGKTNAGESYVVYGSDAGFPAVLSPTDLNGQNGFVIAGADARASLGSSVASAGDVNGDGYDDLVIGAGIGSWLDLERKGASYVIFGAETGFLNVGVSGTDGADWLSLPLNWRYGLTLIDGGSGTDMMSFAGLDAGIYVNTHIGRVVSTYSSGPFDLVMDSIENVTGTAHSDTFFGSDRAETFRGLGGNDSFFGSDGGRDVYQGGSGRDLLSYAFSTEGIAVSLLRQRGFAGDAQQDVITGIEDVTGSFHDDIIWGDHGANKLRGGAGDDTLIGNGGNDYLLGGFGQDVVLYAGNQADYQIRQDGAATWVTDLAGSGGTDLIGQVEILRFADGDLLL